LARLRQGMAKENMRNEMMAALKSATMHTTR